MISEHMQYDYAIIGMNEHAKYRLANMLAHEYTIYETEISGCIVSRKGNQYFISKDGTMYKLEKCLG